MIEEFNEMFAELIEYRNVYNDYTLTSLNIDTDKLTIEVVKKFRRNLDFLKKVNNKIEEKLNS